MFTLLLMLNDAPANLVIGLYLEKIDAAGNGLAGGQNQRADVLVERRGLLELFQSTPRMPCRI